MVLSLLCNACCPLNKCQIQIHQLSQPRLWAQSSKNGAVWKQMQEVCATACCFGTWAPQGRQGCPRGECGEGATSATGHTGTQKWAFTAVCPLRTGMSFHNYMTHTKILEARSEARAAKYHHHPQNKITFFFFFCKEHKDEHFCSSEVWKVANFNRGLKNLLFSFPFHNSWEVKVVHFST